MRKAKILLSLLTVMIMLIPSAVCAAGKITGVADHTAWWDDETYYMAKGDLAIYYDAKGLGTVPRGTGGVLINNPMEFTWAASDTSDPNIRKADVSLISGDIFNELEPFIPKNWTGAVSVDVYYGLQYTGRISKGRENTAYFRKIPTIMSLDVKPETGVDPSKSATTSDYIRLFKYTDKTSIGDYLIVIAYDGSYSISQLIYKDVETAIEALAYYYPVSGSVAWGRAQIPLSVYSVSFSTVTHHVTATFDDTKGSVKPLETGASFDVNQGEDASFAVTANDACRIASLTIDGKAVKPDGTISSVCSFSKVEEAHTITATFEEFTGAPVISADGTVTASLADYVTDETDSDVAAIESSGFVSGTETVNIVGSDGSTKTGGKFTRDGFVSAVKLNVFYDEKTAPLTLTVKPEGGKTFDKSKSYHALLLNKTTNYYDLYPATLNADGNLTMTIKPVGDYFSTGTIFVYSGTAKETGDDPTPVPEPTAESKSSSGCNAGLAVLALLALVPLLDRRKR